MDYHPNFIYPWIYNNSISHKKMDYKKVMYNTFVSFLYGQSLLLKILVGFFVNT